MFKSILKMWQLLSYPERRRFQLVIGLSTIASAFQVVGVGSVFPFVTVLTNPSAAKRLSTFLNVQELLGITSDRGILLFLGFASLVALVVSNGALALSHWASVHFADTVMHRLSVTLFRGYLATPYVAHLRRSVAELKRNVLQEVERFSTLLQTMIQSVTALLTLFGVAVALVFLNPLATLMVMILASGSYALIYVFLRRKLARLATLRLEANRERFKVADEGLAGLKELRVLQRIPYVLDCFYDASRATVGFHTAQTVISSLPRYLLELVAFGSLMMMAVVLVMGGGDIRAAIPLVSVYALAAYRTLPALQQVYNTVVTFRLFSPVISVLESELAEGAQLSPSVEVHAVEESVQGGGDGDLRFRDRIELENVSFSYSSERGLALKNISLVIPYRGFVALVGETGAGKTTLADILLGILTPTEGRVLVDGEEITRTTVHKWQRRLGYVPQDVYLAEDTIAVNIAFGVPPALRDLAAVERAAKAAQIHDFIVALPDGYDTMVGHRGVRLSGGQRQRIGIARALYKQPEVLVLDEATSQLDGVTEAAFMEALDELSEHFTLIVVAHRLATVRHADQLFLLDKGRLIAAGTYAELLKTSDTFRGLVAASDRQKLTRFRGVREKERNL